MNGGCARRVSTVLLLATSLTACSHGDSFAGSTSCSWRPEGNGGEQFDESTPHVCLQGGGPEYRLVASHFAVGSALSVNLTAEPLGRVVVLTVDLEGNADVVVRAGGQIPVAGIGDDGRPFGVLVTAAGGPISRH